MIVRLLLFAAIGTVLLLFLRSTYTFRMVMWDGQIVKQQRTVAGPLREAIADLAKDRKLTGTMTLYPGGYLRCSRSIPEPDRQRLRNVLSQFI